jgi:hypothetical protein
MNIRQSTTDEDLARERIEAALHDHDFCAVCGRPMTIEARDGVLAIECESMRGLGGLRRLLASGLHERHVIDILPEAGDTIPAAA